MSALRPALRKALRSALRPMTGYPTDEGYAWSFLSALPDGWLFTRAGPGGQSGTTSAGLIYTESTVDVPVFRYGEGILLEGSRTNTVKYSADFSGSGGVWQKRGTATFTSNAGTDPKGAGAAILLGGLGTSGDDVYQVTAGTNGTAYAPSFWIKKVTSTGTLRFQNAANRSYGQWDINLATIGSGWERITRTHPAVTVSSEFVGYTNICGPQFIGQSGGPLSVYVWNPQVEVGAFPSSDIPTTTPTSVTRAATSLTKSHTLPLNDWSAQTTVYPQFASTDTGGNLHIATFYKDANNYLSLYKSTTAGEIKATVAVGGTTASATKGSLTWARGDKLRVWVKKTSTGLQVGVNGSAGTEVTTGVADDPWTTPPDVLRLGADEAGTAVTTGFYSMHHFDVYPAANNATFLNALP